MGHLAQAGKDTALNMCIDFNRARTSPWVSAGGGNHNISQVSSGGDEHNTENNCHFWLTSLKS